MIIIFQKLDTKIKFHPKNVKTGVVKNLMTIPLTPEIMRKLIITPWRRSVGPSSGKKNKKIQKDSKNFKNIPLRQEAML